MTRSISGKHGPVALEELSRKTGLILRPLDSATLDTLFARLEEYDAKERTETFDFLTHALNETRASLGPNLSSPYGKPTRTPDEKFARFPQHYDAHSCL
jgi:hypothetical protein